ncbi:MAG TPA: hypothetical protein VFI25_18815 [Planctomycetota bacterium]|nr:hypothetical protein [Planctomycetota bacterium]
MNRRTVLKLAGAGSAGLVVPGWLDRWFLGFGAPFLPGGKGPGDLEAALKSAREAGKPLLVLVIPLDDREKWERGALFGGLLNTAGDEVLADLALCEVACAPVADLRDRLKLAGVSGEPLAVLVETGEKELRGRAVSPALPPQPDPLRGEEWRNARREAEEAARDRIARLAESIRSAVAPDREAIVERAAAAEVGLTPEQMSALVAMADGKGRIDGALADRGAAVLRLHSEDDPRRRERVLVALHAAAVTRFRLKPPPGARWARAGECGTRVEGEENGMVLGCGMGFVPEASRRFLHFFTDR